MYYNIKRQKIKVHERMKEITVYAGECLFCGKLNVTLEKHNLSSYVVVAQEYKITLVDENIIFPEIVCGH